MATEANNEVTAEVGTPAVNENTASTDSTKSFTQDQVNEIVAQRLAKFKVGAIDKAAEQKAAEALSKVTALQEKLESSELEAQILKLSHSGANEALLRKTGLRGEALDSFAADLIAMVPSNGGSTGVAQKASVVEFINRTVSGENKQANWKDQALASINAQMGK